MGDKIAQVLLRFRASKEDIANLKNDLARIRSDIAATEAAAEDVAGAGQDAGNQISKAFDSSTAQRVAQIREEMKATAAQTEATAREFDDLRASIKGAADEQTGGGVTGIFGKTGLLAKGGRELKALPAVPIPGTGLSTDALGKITSLLGTLGPTAVIAAGGIGAVVAAIVIMNKQLEAQKKAYETAIQSSRAYYDAIGGGTTTAEAKKRLDDLNRSIEATQGSLTNEQNALSGAFAAAQKTYGDGLARIMFAVGGIGGSADETKKKLDAEIAERDALQRALDDNALAINDEIEAYKKLVALKDKMADEEVARQVQTAGLIRSGTVDQVKDQIASLEDQNNAYINVINSGKASADEIQKLSFAWNENLKTLASLKDNVLGVVEAREAETKAAEKQAEIQKQSAAAYQKYQSDLISIQDKHQQDVLTAADKYNQSLVDIAEKAAKQSEDLLRKLEDKRSDLARKFADSEADARTKAASDALDSQIKYQRSEADAARDHARDLEKIRKDAEDREFNQVLNRDFAGLFESRRQTAKQIEDSNSQYQQQREERLTAFQQENEDRQRHFIEDELQRQVKYQRDLQEAQIQYQREYAQAARNRNDALQKAAQAYQTDLQLLNQKFQQELAQRRQAVVAELQLIQQSDAQKLALEQQYYTASQQILRNALAQASGQTGGSAVKPRTGPIQIERFATGGRMSAGQVGMVNDGYPGQRESFNGVPLPRGMGLFMPAVGGRVSPGAGAQVSVSFNISGGDPEQIASVVDKKIRTTLKQVFNA